MQSRTCEIYTQILVSLPSAGGGEKVPDGGGHILFSPLSVDASLLPQTLWPVVPEVVRKAGGFGLPGNYSGL